VRTAFFIADVKSLERTYSSLDDAALKDEALRLRFEAKKSERLRRGLIVRAFALVQVAAQRQIKMRLYDVQLRGGLSMVRGQVAEMRTGEGKTFTATLPLFAYSLLGRGALLATSNDYLAKRDATEMRPVYESLGLSVGVIQSEMSREDRRTAYQQDIIYGTMKEFGFDFLRDHSGQRTKAQQQLWFGDSGATPPVDPPVQRKFEFLLIDEADSILIDDARTPLIISAAEDGSTHDQQVELYRWSALHAVRFVEDSHYWYDRERKKVDLTPKGTSHLRSIDKPASLLGVGLLEMYDFMERAIQVHRDHLVDRDYVVRDGEIVIVEEATGRISEGRRWSRGIHQAIEAKQGVEITMDTHTEAKITVQSFVSRFPSIAGMTGTANTSRREFKKIYAMGVAVIPPNRPSRRKTLPTQFALSEQEKFQQLIKDVIKIHDTGRPILIGTRSIAKSELLSKLFGEKGIEHEVLNARQIEREADIIAAAGVRGRITVATNMAGRGTDIKIDDEVKALGGLHVIGTEIHESSRIDQQLFGRCGRQGDPGTVQQYFSGEDKLLDTAFGLYGADRLRQQFKKQPPRNWQRLFYRAQRMVEQQHFRARRILMYNERELAKSQREMGLDPILDNYD